MKKKSIEVIRLRNDIIKSGKFTDFTAFKFCFKFLSFQILYGVRCVNVIFNSLAPRRFIDYITSVYLFIYLI